MHESEKSMWSRSVVSDSSIHGIFQARVLEWGAIVASYHPAISPQGETLPPRQYKRPSSLLMYIGAEHNFYLAWEKSRRIILKGNEFSGGRMKFQDDRGTISCPEWRKKHQFLPSFRWPLPLMEDRKVIALLSHGTDPSFWNQAGVLISSAK